MREITTMPTNMRDTANVCHDAQMKKPTPLRAPRNSAAAIMMKDDPAASFSPVKMLGSADGRAMRRKV